MDTANSSVSVKDKKETSVLDKIANVEKKLWAIVCTKGLLHNDVKSLYENVCCSYETILLSDCELNELQEIEYSLWKLHYRQIDEFRKRLKKSSDSEMNARILEGLKSFLDETTKYYKGLLIKIRRYYGLPEEFSFYKHGGLSASIEAKRLSKLQLLCHRFLVCLGDLARYREQCEKEDNEHHDWSVAVSHYVEASMVWPDSGNPQNQLAVLAMYVGDEFLALYHCVRSLAVKEPFPDAWNNLTLLFERNRSADLHFLSIDAHFDNSNPCARVLQLAYSSSNGSLKTECDSSREKNLWILLIRLIGFFFIEFRLEDFLSTFATTLNELDSLMSLDDEKLKAVLESYQRLDSARRGPFRVLQVVSIFIFAIERLINNAEVNESKSQDDMKQIVLIQMALAAAFIFMERVAARCLRAKASINCPLLPALLVFTEWLPNILDNVETYLTDEKSKSAISYFFSSFTELLKQWDGNREEASGSIALWEDYELRGFQPLAHSHSSLDFSTQSDFADSSESGAHYRTHRISKAAMRIAYAPTGTCRLISYDKSTGRFQAVDSNKFPEEDKVEFVSDMIVELKELDRHSSSVQGSQKSVDKEELSLQKPRDGPGKHDPVDEDEVILFKPLMRYNSAPVSSILSNDQSFRTKADEQIVPANESLQRATSLLIAQNQGSQQDSPAFQCDLTNFQHSQLEKPQKSTEATISHGSPSFRFSIPGGPPSLNAWVMDRGNLSNDRTEGRNESRHTLTPIDEISSTTFGDLSISETRDSISTSGLEAANNNYSPLAYAAPVPSAPLLPDDAVWFNGSQSKFLDYNHPGRITITNGSSNMEQVAGQCNWNDSYQRHDYNPSVPGPVLGYQPARPMTSSEWLRHYREINNHQQQFVAHTWPAQYAGNLNCYDNSWSGPINNWVTPLASNPTIYEQNTTGHLGYPPVCVLSENTRMDKTFYGYERSSPYVCSPMNQPEPLLHPLREKEWILQQDPMMRGPNPTYNGR